MSAPTFSHSATCSAALARKRRPPRRLVLVGSTAVYAQNSGEWVDESSTTAPSEFSGLTLLRSEALARSAAAECVVVRFGGIYGPGRKRFVDSVRSGALRLGAGAEYTNRIHRDDCAEVLRHLLTVATPAPLYVGVDDEPADRRDVAAWIARRLGVAPVTTPAPSDATPRGKRCSNRRLRDSWLRLSLPELPRRLRVDPCHAGARQLEATLSAHTPEHDASMTEHPAACSLPLRHA